MRTRRPESCARTSHSDREVNESRAGFILDELARAAPWISFVVGVALLTQVTVRNAVHDEDGHQRHVPDARVDREDPPARRRGLEPESQFQLDAPGRLDLAAPSVIRAVELIGSGQESLEAAEIGDVEQVEVDGEL